MDELINKVLVGLTCCTAADYACEHCPYNHAQPCTRNLKTDALKALLILKEGEKENG